VPNGGFFATAYKHGQAWASVDRATVQLKPASTSAQQRINELSSDTPSCDHGGASTRALYPMIEALYRETRQIARTEEDNFSVELLGKIAAGAP
jgi:hypothetical protein